MDKMEEPALDPSEAVRTFGVKMISVEDSLCQMFSPPERERTGSRL